jgi:hypothetical protein
MELKHEAHMSLITLMGLAATAYAGLIYELTPNIYRAAPGEIVQTFASVTNTGPEVLYYAYSFVDPGTVPVTGITGQLPPLVIQPGDRIPIVAASITMDPTAAAGVYRFNEGVGYRIALDAPDVIEASDVGTLVAVPEPTFLLPCSFVVLAMLPLPLKREYRRAGLPQP